MCVCVCVRCVSGQYLKDKDGNKFMGDLDNILDPDAFFQSSELPKRAHPRMPVENIHPLNLPLLKAFFDEFGMMRSRQQTRATAKVQRKVNRAVRRARHMGLITFKRGRVSTVVWL